MKYFLLATCFLTFNALACPDIAGTYTQCKSQTGELTGFDVKLERKLVGNVYHYTMTEFDAQGPVSPVLFITDGRVHSVKEKDPASGKEYLYEDRAQCVNDSVGGIFRTVSVSEVRIVSEVGLKLKKQNNQLVMNIQVKTRNGASSKTITCL